MPIGIRLTARLGHGQTTQENHMSDQTKLLPCPFCGAQPTDYAIEPHAHNFTIGDFKMPDHEGSHIIECQCGAGFVSDTREAAAALWNARATLSQPARAQPQAPSAELSEQDATLLNQAYDMLLEYADHHRDLGNDSAAMGAECSADAVLRLAASAASAEPPAQPQEAGEHPPHRLCGCSACAPSFADETDPPATQASNPVA